MSILIDAVPTYIYIRIVKYIPVVCALGLRYLDEEALKAHSSSK